MTRLRPALVSWAAFCLLLVAPAAAEAETVRLRGLKWSPSGTVTVTVELPDDWTAETRPDGVAIFDPEDEVRILLSPREAAFELPDDQPLEIVPEPSRTHAFMPLRTGIVGAREVLHGCYKGPDFKVLCTIPTRTPAREVFVVLPTIRIDGPFTQVDVAEVKGSKAFELRYRVWVPTGWTARQAERRVLFCMPGPDPSGGSIALQAYDELPVGREEEAALHFVEKYLKTATPTGEIDTATVEVDGEAVSLRLFQFRRDFEGGRKADFWAGIFDFGDLRVLVSIIIPDGSTVGLSAYRAILESFDGAATPKESEK